MLLVHACNLKVNMSSGMWETRGIKGDDGVRVAACSLQVSFLSAFHWLHRFSLDIQPMGLQFGSCHFMFVKL